MPARAYAWSAVPCDSPLIHGGEPPPKWKAYSQAMNAFDRRTASAVISSSSSRRPASSQLALPLWQAPNMWLAFLKVESGWSWSPLPGKYWYRISLPLKLTWSPAPG